jgi:hypothetical protein
MPDDTGSAGTGAWIGFELTSEQRELIRVRTGRDAGALYLTLSEIASGRFIAAPVAPQPDSDFQHLPRTQPDVAEVRTRLR